jgi:hypothetical protein
MNKAKIKAKQILTKHIEVVREYPHGTRLTHDVFIEDREHATITAELLSKETPEKKGFWDEVIKFINQLNRV